MARFSVPANSGSGGGDVSFTAEGCIVFPNDGEICNTADSSGDGSGFSTMSINPDTNTNDNRYIILDPTAPNHIHIRAGGEQDGSSADLFLGGERNNVHVSDGGRDVVINTRPTTVVNSYVNANPVSNANFIVSNSANIYVGDTFFYAEGGDIFTVDSVTSDSPSLGLQTVTAIGGTFITGGAYVFSHEESWNNSWLFNDAGVLSGPAMGSVAVNGIFNNFVDDLYIGSSEAIQMGGTGGEFLNDSSIPSNQIATIGDIASTVSGETVFTVAGGTTGTQPTFTGAPLFSGSYVKVGGLVHFQIQVDMDNITSFGTGQYYVDLPFAAKYAYQVREGCVHDISTSRQYPIGGHVLAGESRLYLNFVDSNGRDDAFTYNTPFVLAIADNFHIAGTYIADDTL
jgi:hypothetical protein